MKIKEYKAIIEEIFRLMEEGIHVVGEDEKTLIYNQAMANMEKMRQADVLRRPFRNVFTSMEEGESTLLSTLKTGKTFADQQQTYRNKDGREVTTENSTHPVVLDGKIIGAIEIAKNVTTIQNMSQHILRLQKEGSEDDQDESGSPGIPRYTFQSLIGKNRQFLDTLDRARKAARSNASVLICGETGTGKELIAQSIHYDSSRQGKPFLAQNCAALPEHLLEGILFGTAKGGFTGALDRAGLFEQANGGTLLLDEISAMPYELQGKLLRVLQENYLRRVGGSKDIPVDVRIIATINEPAEKLIQSGRLRRDLYYRLCVILINMPPLRERRDDIPLLAERFLSKHNVREGKEVWMISEGAKELLKAYDYPGNVRELENIIAAAISMTDGEHVLTVEHLLIDQTNVTPFLAGKTDLHLATELGLDAYLASLEQLLIQEAMEVCNGNISKAAARLGIKRQTLQHKLKKSAGTS